MKLAALLPHDLVVQLRSEEHEREPDRHADLPRMLFLDLARLLPQGKLGGVHGETFHCEAKILIVHGAAEGSSGHLFFSVRLVLPHASKNVNWILLGVVEIHVSALDEPEAIGFHGSLCLECRPGGVVCCHRLSHGNNIGIDEELRLVGDTLSNGHRSERILSGGHSLNLSHEARRVNLFVKEKGPGFLPARLTRRWSISYRCRPAQTGPKPVMILSGVVRSLPHMPQKLWWSTSTCG